MAEAHLLNPRLEDGLHNPKQSVHLRKFNL